MKYQVNDYIAAPKVIFSRIEAIFPGSTPLYCLVSNRVDSAPHIHWFTEYELDKIGYEKKDPDFKLWSTLEEGDMVRTGQEQDSPVVKALARAGNMAMLSMPPTSDGERKILDALASQLEDLTDGEISKKKVKEIVSAPTMTFNEAHKMAQGHWYNTDALALMNWELLRE